MSNTYSGGCQCGAVAFRIDGTFDSFFLCHCSRCRRDTGSSHAANLFSATATIAWTKGGDCVRRYRVPATRHLRSFCVDCGSALPTQQDGLLVTPAGSLDGDLDLRPVAHICYASRANWDDGLDALPRLDGLPGAPET